VGTLPLLASLADIDLTTLAGDDTPGNVQRLCAKAKSPVRPDILASLGCASMPLTVGAVCVYPARVKDAVEALKGTDIPVASVATGFPSGQISHEHKLEEIRQCVADGAMEIDIVIPRTHALNGDWEALYKEVCDFRTACGPAHMKAILAVGELPTFTVVYQCSLVCMMAGSDFIKTSTGKEPTNATLPVSLVMCRAIREYQEKTGHKVGFKPAGGIRDAKTACAYLALMREELGIEWQKNHLFRIGASALLTDIERQLHHSNTGDYAATYYMAMS
jgi:deoxyribose-phosphate aldolase